MARPTIYFDKFTKKKQKEILVSYAKGDTDIAAIDILGINQDTFYEWLKDENKPEFSELIKKGKLKSLLWWERKGKEGLEAGKLNPAIYCFIMKSRFKEHYGEEKEKPETIVIIDKGKENEG